MRRGWFRQTASLLAFAIGTFVKWVAIIVLLGVVLAVACALIAGGGWAIGSSIALLAFLACVVAAVPLATQRTIYGTLAELARRTGIAGWAVGAVAERFASLAAPRLGGSDEALPLHELEQALTQRLDALLATPHSTTGLKGAIRRWVHRRLARVIRRVTLAEFRREGSNGLDGELLRRHVLARIDARVQEHLLASSRRITIVVLVALCVVLPLLAIGLRSVL